MPPPLSPRHAPRVILAERAPAHGHRQVPRHVFGAGGSLCHERHTQPAKDSTRVDRFMFAERRNALAFWLGSRGGRDRRPVATCRCSGWRATWVSCGRHAMDAGMLWGMALIVAGIGLAPMACCREGATHRPARSPRPPRTPRSPAPLGGDGRALDGTGHRTLKPASLGFVTPGSRGIRARTPHVALLPLSALVGTGGLLRLGRARGPYGRRAAILLCLGMFIAPPFAGPCVLLVKRAHVLS